MATIVFNGKTYNSLEEMPPMERQAYEQMANILVDKNGNGIPDLFEGDVAKNVMTAYSSMINVNGQNYADMNELPPYVREKIKSAFNMMNTLGITPSISTAMMGSQPNVVQVGQEPVRTSQPLISREYVSTPVHEEDKGNARILYILLGLVVAFLCLGAMAVGAYIFFIQ